MRYQVDLAPVEQLLKNPKRIPWEIGDVLQAWVEQVERFGLPEVKMIKRYRDHALKGQRSGERSISLSFQWRAIYTENHSGDLVIVRIEEVTPHDYRKK
jgi:mRNA-degrading endonuclease YafQ of YafQ-DinJ toxin-antitoxin module